MMRRFLLAVALILSLSTDCTAIDIVGTGATQADAIQNALSHVMMLVADSEIESSFVMEKRWIDGKRYENVRDFLSSRSEFYTENIAQYITELSDNRVVFTLSDSDINELRHIYSEWKLTPEISASVKIDDGIIDISVRKVRGVGIIVESIAVDVATQKVSMLCSDWIESDGTRTIQALQEPITLSDMPYHSQIKYRAERGIFDIGKRVQAKVSVRVRGRDRFDRIINFKI